MSDSSSSRSPRAGGANPSPSSPSFGESILGWLRNLAGGNGEGDLRESLEEVLEEHHDVAGGLNPEQRAMLLNILSFGELQVDDIMVPRADIIAVEAKSTLSQLVEAFRQARHSRLPVYRETLDDMLGFVHIKDVVQYWNDGGDFRLESVLHELLVVPPSMLALDLMARMKATRNHMAVVVDEYGGTDGLVTIEDAVEEIVGDIADEHEDEEAPMLIELPDGSFDADARMEVDDFEARLGLDLLPDDLDDEVDTLGGLVFHLMGRVPRRGEKVQHASGLEFEVTDADPRRVKRLKVRGKDMRAAAVHE